MNTRNAELIDKYLRDELAPQELHQWNKIRRQPEVQAELAFRKDLRIALTATGREALKKKLQAQEYKITHPETADYAEPDSGNLRDMRSSSVKKWALRLAAGVLVLVGAWWLLGEEKGEAAGADLFATAWQAYPNEITVTVRGAQTKGALAQVMNLYGQGDYAAALQQMETLQTPADTLAFYRANALLGAGNIKEAAQAFDQIAAQPQHPYVQAAEWYQALIATRTQDFATASRILKSISQQKGHPFQQKAQGLLAKLPV